MATRRGIGHRRLLALLLALAVSRSLGLAPPSTASAQVQPIPQAYLPVVVKNGALATAPGSFVSSVVVAAAGQLPAGGSTFSVQFLRADGSVAATLLDQPLRESGQLFYLGDADLPDGRYAAVVLGRQPVIAQANLAAQAPTRASAYVGVPAANAGTGARLGNVFKDYFGYTSVLSVQNAAGVPTQVTVTYRDQSGSPIGPPEQRIIAANGFADVPQAQSSLPDGFVGSASVSSSGQNVAVAVHVYNAAGELIGVSGGGTIANFLVSLPVVYKNYSADGWMSSILVQAPLDQPAFVRITFRGSGLSAPVVLTDTIPAGATRQYWQGNTPADLPDGFLGSATVESGQAVAAFVNTRNGRGDASGYVGAASSGPNSPKSPYGGISQQVRFADLYNAYSALRWTSSLVVQNANVSTAAPITIAYYQHGVAAPVKTVTETLQPGETRLHYLPNEGLPAGFTGAAIVTSSGGQIVGVANTLALGLSGGDRLLSYEGATTYPNTPPAPE